MSRPSATIGDDASIGAVRRRRRRRAHRRAHDRASARDRSAATPQIGDDCVIHARVSIRERVAIGHRVILQDGAVIGSDGFGFARRPDGTHHKIPQIGGVVIEDDVEIGANTTIDRPAVGETRIGAGTKIDNLVQIAHGVTIGRNVLLAAQVGIAGSTTIEDRRDAGGPGRAWPATSRSARARSRRRRPAFRTRSSPARSSPAIRRSTTATG